jgi:uncharacterized protein (TIGR02646 family)
MRPVIKWDPLDPTLNQPINIVYQPYKTAKPDLVRNIGFYCSYCERRLNGEALHVEHIQPKGLPQYRHLMYSWSNFLLSCSRCNGRDNKGDADVIPNQILLPHLNDTYHSLKYLEGGLVIVNPNILPNLKLEAQALIDLVGLDKCPGHAHHLVGDIRWMERDNAWKLASKYHLKLASNETDADTVTDLAVENGFWSVWFSIFFDFPDVLNLLVTKFNGTNPAFF